MRVVTWYHVWAGGAWAEAVAEHDAAIEAAGLPKPLVGVTGHPDDRAAFIARAADRGWQVVFEQAVGWEQATLSALRRGALASDEPAAVLYCHAKGSRHDMAGTNSAWRREMTRRLVGEHQAALLLLEQHDAVGCCWMNAAQYPDMQLPGSGIFAGNFWWATRRYLRTLPEPDTSVPGGAEAWIGQGSPDVVDFLPHWPVRMLDGDRVLTAAR
jgi:hypothetical protein